MAGHLASESDVGRVRSWVSAAVARARLRNATIGALGGIYDGMLDIQTDITALAACLGSRFRCLEFSRLEAACASIGQPLSLRRHDGYDHGYYFISTFMADHLAHHHRQLTA